MRKTTTKAQREQHLNRVAKGLAQGQTIRQQAQELDRSLTMISMDRRTLRMRWAEQNKNHIREERFDQLEKLNRVEEEAWEAWDRSIGETAKQTRRVTQSNGQQVQVVSEETVTLTGDPRYLDTINKVVSRRCAILGLDAPQEMEVNATSINVEAKLDIGISDASRWLGEVLGGGAVQDSEVAVQERPVLPSGIRMQEGGREPSVDTGAVPGGGGESERDAGSVGAGALQVDDHHVRDDDTEHPEQSGSNMLHSILQPTNGQSVSPTDQGGTRKQ